MELTGRLVKEAAREYPDKEGVEFDEEERKLEVLPVAFAEGSWTWEDLEWVVRWKSWRATGYFEDNDPGLAGDIVDRVTHAMGVGEKVEMLRKLDGVEVPMASAFLMFMNPTAYTVLDVRAWNALQQSGCLENEIPNTPGVDEYLRYLGVCHTLAREFDIDLRELDRALWVIGGDG